MGNGVFFYRSAYVCGMRYFSTGGIFVWVYFCTGGIFVWVNRDIFAWEEYLMGDLSMITCMGKPCHGREVCMGKWVNLCMGGIIVWVNRDIFVWEGSFQWVSYYEDSL